VIASVFAALLVAMRANVHFMRPKAALLHQLDEAYAVALARRMLSGHFLPYVDGVSHRGPLYYATVALAVRVFGNGTWMPMRALGLLSITVTIAVGFFAAERAKHAVAGAVMALVYAGALCVGMPLDDGLAYNSEQLLSLFAMMSLLAAVLALGSRASAHRVLLSALSGVALSASGLCKQTGFALLLPLGLWIACTVRAAPELSERERKGIPLAFAAGVVTPILALVARYAVAGELATLYYYLVTYNTQVYLPSFLALPAVSAPVDALHSHAYVLLALAPLVSWAIFAPFSGVRRWKDVAPSYAEHGFETTVGIAALVMPFAADASLRDFEHYYVQAIPYVGFLLGVVVERLLGEHDAAVSSVHGLVRRTVVLLPLVAVVEIGWEHRVRAFPFDPSMPSRFTTQDSPVCRFLAKHTGPDDAIFVWGFYPEPYTACNRRPASRYVYTTFVSGFVPHVIDSPKNDAARVAPGSHRILEEELIRERPAAIIDAPYTLGLRSLRDDAFLRHLVDTSYCPQKVDLKQPGMRVWIRAGLPGCDATRSSR
jgi:hypothetical protein